MMRSVLRIFSRESNGLSEAAFIIGFFTLFSQVLGLIRDRLLAHYVGPGMTLDVYYASFRLPDLLFTSIASLASITVLLPFLIDRMKGDDTSEARNFFSRIFSMIAILLTGASVILFFLMPFLARLIAPGFSEEATTLLVAVSRIMLVSPILIGVSNMLGAATQMFRNFSLFALSPVVYNLGIILGIVFLYPWFGIHGLVAGVLVGAAFHVGVQVPFLVRKQFLPKLTFWFKWKEFIAMSRISLPRTAGLAVGSLTLLVFVSMISHLAEGAISLFQFSQNLQAVPIALVGASFSVASFPALVELFQGRRMGAFVSYIQIAIRRIVFWSIPFMALFIVLRAQIVRVIYGTQNLTWGETRLVAALLALFMVALLSQNIVLLFTRAFYAIARTRVPLIVNTLSELIKIGTAFFFLHLLRQDIIFTWSFAHYLKISDVPGIELLAFPLAYIVGSWVNALLLGFMLQRAVGSYIRGVLRSLMAAIAGGCAIGGGTWMALQFFDPFFSNYTFTGVFLHGLLSGVVGIIIGVAMLRLVHSKDLREITETLHRKFWKADVIAEPQDLGQS